MLIPFNSRMSFYKLFFHAIMQVGKINTIASKQAHWERNTDATISAEEMSRLTLGQLMTQIPIYTSEIKEGIKSLKEGRTTPQHFDGFRDDVQDILFTAAGLFYYSKAPVENYIELIETGRRPTPIDAEPAAEVRLMVDNDTAGKMMLELTPTYESGGPVTTRDELYIQRLLASALQCAYDVYCMGLASGYTVHSDWAEVVRSNYTKFDKDFADIHTSCEKYFSKGVVVQPTLSPCGMYYAYIVPYAQEVGGKDYPKGKYLKSHRFEEPNYARRMPMPTSRKISMPVTSRNRAFAGALQRLVFDLVPLDNPVMTKVDYRILLDWAGDSTMVDDFYNSLPMELTLSVPVVDGLRGLVDIMFGITDVEDKDHQVHINAAMASLHNHVTEKYA